MKHSTENLRHTRWECKYHVVFIPKYRKKSIYGWVRKELGPIIRHLAHHKERVVEEGTWWQTMFTCCCRYHRSTRSPGWWGLSRARVPLRSHEGSWIGNFVGQNFWARGYYVSTVGRDEAQIREYKREQEKEDERLDEPKILE